MRADASIRWAFLAACIAMLCGAAGFRAAVASLNAYLVKRPAPLREPLSTIPSTLGPWRMVGEEEKLTDAMVEALGTKSFLNRVYAIDGQLEKGWLHLHIAFYTGLIDTVPHIPERCFTAGGMVQKTAPVRVKLPVDRSTWREGEGPENHATGLRYPLATYTDPVTRRRSDVTMPIGEPMLSVIEFQKPDDPRLEIIGGYCFIANGQITPSAYAVRQLSFRLSEKYAYFCKVQFTGQYRGTPAAQERFVQDSADLMGWLLPYLMYALPDWPEYEAKSAAGADGSK